MRLGSSEEVAPYEEKYAKWTKTDYVVGWANTTFPDGLRRSYFRCWAPKCVGTCLEGEMEVE